MPSYIMHPPLEVYYSDMSGPGFVVEPELGLDPKNLINTNYAKYSKPYSTFQWLGGVNLRLHLNSIAISAGDQLEYYVYNITTQNMLSRYTYRQVFQNYGGGVQQEAIIMVGMPALSQLGAGILEGFGSLTTANTVYVFGSTFRTLVLP